MSDIVSTPPAPSSPDGALVTTPEFWPDIDINKLRAAIDLGGEIPHARLVPAVEEAAVFVMDELSAFQALAFSNGADDLASIDPDNQIGGSALLVMLFLSAITSQTAAVLADRHPDLTSTREGSDRGEQRRSMADGYRRNATRTIRQIKGQTGVMVELV